MIPDYTLEIRTVRTCEYSIQVSLPASYLVGDEQLQTCIMVKNSYNGKTKFSIQGRSAHKKKE